MTADWYLDNIPPESDLDQGDIFLGCPLFSVENPFNFKNPDAEELPIIRKTANIVILTQTCDLVYDEANKQYPVKHVVCAPLYDSKTMEVTENKYSFFCAVQSNSRPLYHLLGRYDGGEDILPMNYQVVDFSSIIILDYAYLTAFKNFHGKRLRLNTPHRELLSYRLGNYFSRIGLPDESYIDRTDLKKFI